MIARIFRPAQTAMQSGRAGTLRWVLEYEPSPLRPDPLMGWTSTRDTHQQIRLQFKSLAEAIAYADRHGIAYETAKPHEHHWRSMSYADNYRTERLIPFTH
jgi:hypothetical protein